MVKSYRQNESSSCIRLPELYYSSRKKNLSANCMLITDILLQAYRSILSDCLMKCHSTQCMDSSQYYYYYYYYYYWLLKIDSSVTFNRRVLILAEIVCYLRHVRPSAPLFAFISLARRPMEGLLRNMILGIFMKINRKPRIWLKPGKNFEHCTWRLQC